ncbi:MAG: DUF262 domain-containing HNH endonuclease family protein [Rickettsiales bacterium]|jgi:uncharacterized protein with ParB-like and HNH nuclease domain|nr:DUF262 domain-containing HNH endonuclease family protein [Rickettsiales bacterium]
MEAKEKRLLKDMLYGRGNFIIPVYQRNYDWNVGNCKVLFEDITDLIENDNEHFTGAIVSVAENDNRIIIDGQQRITTINLLLIAIYRHLPDGKSKQMILENYLINRFEEKEKLKLKVSQNNKNDFNSLFETPIEDIKNRKKSSRIYENFVFFYEAVLGGGYDIEKLIKAVERLQVVDIMLKRGSNPQLIFETLNSTGKALEQSDLIRNYLLMNLEHKEQEKIFYNYWEKIENNTKDNSLDFFRNYLMFKKQSYAKDNLIYFEFKKEFDSNYDKEKLAKELLKYSTYYKQIKDYTLFDDKYIKEKLINLISGNFLEYTVIISFLFMIIDEKMEDNLVLDDVYDIFDILESFLFRRFVCELKTSVLRKLFMSLGKWIKDLMQEKNCSFTDALLFYLNKYNFPNDILFRERFVSFEFYKKKTNSLQIQHLLTEIEKINNKEVVSDNLQLEHIAPQTLTSDWKKYFGDELGYIENDYLHTIGNLTLTGNNGTLSNKSFEKKKEEYKESNIKITRDLSNYEKWNLENIKKRATVLADIAISIWKYKNTDIKNEDTESRIFLSDEDFNFTGSKIKKMYINDKECKNIDSWNDAYIKILSFLIDIDAINFVEKIVNSKFNKHITDKENISLRKTPRKISNNNIYFETTLSTMNGISLIRKIIDKLDYPDINADCIMFYLVER